MLPTPEPENTGTSTDSWLEALHNDLLSAKEQPDGHILRCAVISGTTTLIHGKKLTELHPNARLWLDHFARRNNLSLRPRRNRTHAPSELRKRRNSESQITLGINLLIQSALQHLNVSLPVIGHSARNSFRATHPRLPAGTLVGLSHAVKSNGKKFTIDSNVFLQQSGGNCPAINLYACVINAQQVRKTFCYFESDTLHALAYPMGRNYVFELILGGGFGLSASCGLPLNRFDKVRLHLSFLTQPGGNCYSGVLRSCYSIVMNNETTGLIQSIKPDSADDLPVQYDSSQIQTA
ncbi:hypothetical protein AB833_29745 [Chromatiales bacterium (ex Bugula neritina AB1)]|nr:hypothetical protein AB833_29745 [Chromatiales bacterium (ex Bugula neritina AB1)]